MSRLRVVWSRGPNFDLRRHGFAGDNRNQDAFAVFPGGEPCRPVFVTPSRYRRGGVDPERPRGGDVA
jgi:hypothetical protein